MKKYKLLTPVGRIQVWDRGGDGFRITGVVPKRSYVEVDIYTNQYLLGNYYKQELYLIKNPFKIKVYLEDIQCYDHLKFDRVSFSCYRDYIYLHYLKREKILEELRIFGQHNVAELYYDTENICPTCISLMKIFDDCAPIIETKFGKLIL